MTKGRKFSCFQCGLTDFQGILLTGSVLTSLISTAWTPLEDLPSISSPSAQEATTTPQKAALMPGGETLFCGHLDFLLLVVRMRVSRAPELTDVSEKSDIRPASSPGLFSLL